MALFYQTLSTIFLSVLLFLRKMVFCGCCAPRVMSNCGEVKGSRMKTVQGKKVLAFRGIPYGKPPVGKYRFARSEPFGCWRGVHDGTMEANKSLQPNVLFPDIHFICEGAEDCLYLNVYTKDADVEARKPVVVFLHGGAFVVGSCEAMLYGPQVLLDEDLVLVGVNYRLGILGWLSLETEAAPGNLGLHDQYLALLWVKHNIAAFGGDPERVTLMGQSAGAMSALLHLVSPFSRGLFHRVIALSGTPSTVLLHNDRHPRMYGLEVARRLGCTELQDPDEVLQFLQSKEAKQILKVSTMFLDWDYTHPLPWTPCTDPHSSEPMLPRSFLSAVAAGDSANIPVIIGCCKDEGLILTAKFFKERSRWDLMVKDWNIWAPLFIFHRERDLITAEDRGEIETLTEFYFGSPTVQDQQSTDENILKLTDMVGQAWFFQPMDVDSKALAQQGIPVYTFMLSSPPNFSLFDLFRLKLKDLGQMFTMRRLFNRNPFHKEYGVCHCDDLSYLFPIAVPGFPPTVVTPLQQKTRQIFLDMIYSFGSSGKPVLQDVDWTPVSESNKDYLDIGTILQMTRDPYKEEQLNLWRNIMGEQKKRLGQPSSKPFSAFFHKIAIERMDS